MTKLIQVGIAVVLAFAFAAHVDSAEARKRERDRYGFYAPYFGNDPEDRYRFRTERRGAYAKGARMTPPSSLESYAYDYGR